VTYRERMNILYDINDNHMEANVFVKQEISVWGDEYVDDLFDKGYVPVKLSNGKWAWLLVNTANELIASS
jgi:hypothetical protein